jgi:ParB family chromosome partitioning protein
VGALEQLGRDTVEAVVWPMSEADALVLDRSMRFSEQETPLEQGWLLAELERRFGYTLEDLAKRFDRSVNWVSRRLALVEQLPETVQQRIRGEISARGHEVSGAEQNPAIDRSVAGTLSARGALLRDFL